MIDRLSYYEWGLDKPLLVRHELIRPDGDGCRIAYVSDIHLRRGRSALLSDQVLDALDRAEPDIVLLGGDLIDHASELGALRRLLRCIGSVAPTFAVAGNHDVSVGLEATREAVEDAGSTWIQGRTVVVSHKARTISLSGIGGEPRSSCDISVLCTHNPRVWKRVRKQGFDLVLAGHPSKNIAADLGISQRTVENHRHAIMARTGCKSLPALARLALAAASPDDHTC